jgi:hypothetical protein
MRLRCAARCSAFPMRLLDAPQVSPPSKTKPPLRARHAPLAENFDEDWRPAQLLSGSASDTARSRRRSSPATFASYSLPHTLSRRAFDTGSTIG